MVASCRWTWHQKYSASPLRSYTPPFNLHNPEKYLCSQFFRQSTLQYNPLTKKKKEVTEKGLHTNHDKMALRTAYRGKEIGSAQIRC